MNLKILAVVFFLIFIGLILPTQDVNAGYDPLSGDWGCSVHGFYDKKYCGWRSFEWSGSRYYNIALTSYQALGHRHGSSEIWTNA